MEAASTEKLRAGHGLDGSLNIGAAIADPRLTKWTFLHPVRMLVDFRKFNAERLSCPMCPQCSYMVSRSRRLGWKDSLAKVIGRYPFRCRACNYRFYLSRRTT